MSPLVIRCRELPATRLLPLVYRVFQFRIIRIEHDRPYAFLSFCTTRRERARVASSANLDRWRVQHRSEKSAAASRFFEPNEVVVAKQPRWFGVLLRLSSVRFPG